MEAIAKLRKYGNLAWQDRKINLPDGCKRYFDLYNLEMVEMHNVGCMCLYFQTKENPDVDVVSHTIQRPEIHTNLCNGFKEAFELLEKHMNPVVENVTIVTQNDEISSI